MTSLNEYLTTYAGQMAERVEAGLPALFDPERDELSSAVRDLSDEAMSPYPAQACAVEAAVRAYAHGARTLDLIGEMGTGKASRNGTPVLTPHGWRAIETLAPGDDVIAPDGTVSKVSGVYPQGMKRCCRVLFSDGTSTECSYDHLWTVQTPLRKWRNQPPLTLTTQDIDDRGLVDAAGNRKWFIPLVAPADLSPPSPAPLPLDPYVLGLLLGDGCFTEHAVAFSSADDELIAAIETLPCDLRQKNKYDWTLSTPRGQPNPVLESMRSLRLSRCRSWEKFVPAQYLWTTAANRLALLHGLIDTDGSVDRSAVEFTTTSPRLRDDVAFIVRSLGGTVSTKERRTTYSHNGEKRTGRASWRIHIFLPPDVPPCRLPRKLERYSRAGKYEPTRAITCIEDIGYEECTCIMVDHPDHLYIVNDFIVTHNTCMAVWIVRALEQRLGRRLRVAMTVPNQLTGKWRDHWLAIIPDADVTIARNWKSVAKLSRARRTVVKTITHADGSTSTQKNARWADPERTQVFILPRDRGKLGYSYRVAVGVRNKLTEGIDGKVIKHAQIRCPKCWSPVLDSDGDEVAFADMAKKGGGPKARQQCRVCGEALWQAHNGKPGPFMHPLTPVPGIAPRRFAPAAFLKRLKAPIDLYIPDECFPGHTKVATIHGHIPIRDVRVGDLVWSRNHDGQAVLRSVSRVIAKPLTGELIRVKHESGEFCCTPNHQIYVGRAARRAETLKAGDPLRVLQGDVLPQNGDQTILLEELSGEARLGYRREERGYGAVGPVDPRGSREPPSRTGEDTVETPIAGDKGLCHLRGGVQAEAQDSEMLLSTLRGDMALATAVGSQQGCCVHAGEEEDGETASRVVQSHEATKQGPCYSREECGHIARSSILWDEGRQWLAHQAAGDDVGTSRLALRSSSEDGQPFLEVRRGRPRPPTVEGGDRTGRPLAPHCEAEEPTPSQDGDAGDERLGRPSILELSRGQGPGRSGEALRVSRIVSVERVSADEQLVYDLEVEETHNYFANGVLVSNCHELKGAGSLQGQMLADIAGCAHRSLKLTGTLTGGYAHNVLHLLWRTAEHKLVADEILHGDDDEFTKRYGVLETQRRYRQEYPSQSIEHLIQGRGKKAGADRVKAKPGISPLLFTSYLLDQTIFIRLAEMHEQLPGFTETVHILPMDAECDEALHAMQEAFADHRDSLPRGQKCRAWSAAQAAFLRWPDKPWVEPYTVMDIDDDGNWFPAFDVPSLPKREYPKERRIRRLVKRNMLRGRKTWIYTELSGRGGAHEWDWMAYLEEYLTSHGVRCAVLRTEGDGGPKPEDREAWIAKTAPDVDVIISNPSLVQTGLDLYDFPSIVYAFPGVNPYTLRQASRRAWRLGQSADCEVDYIVYDARKGKSVQNAALTLMSQKMAAALALEGDFGAEGLADLSGGDDMATMLARFIDGTLGALDARDAFSQYRERLEACMPSLRPIEEVPEIPAAMTTERHHGEIALRAPQSPPEARQSPARQSPAPAPAGLNGHSSQPTAAGNEPASVSDRKALRLRALCEAMGGPPHESVGDWHRWHNSWVQMVAKARKTVRARNFEAIAEQHPDAVIAFVEPEGEAGPVGAGAERHSVGGVRYVVSFMAAKDYLAGERLPGMLACAAYYGPDMRTEEA